MMKKLLFVSVMAFLLGIPQVMAEVESRGPIEEEVSAVVVTATDSYVRVQNACNSVLEIYNVLGVKVGTYRIDSSDKMFSVSLPKGCYLLKVGKFVRKVSIR